LRSLRHCEHQSILIRSTVFGGRRHGVLHGRPHGRDALVAAQPGDDRLALGLDEQDETGAAAVLVPQRYQAELLGMRGRRRRSWAARPQRVRPLRRR